MMMKLRTGHPSGKAKIQMIPLIDVIFLLLVFFIYAMVSMVVQRGIPVDLPQAANVDIEKKPALIIAVTRDNQIMIEGRRVTIEQLPALVATELLDAPDTPVYIRGDEKSELGVAISVLDRLRRAGVTHVSFEARLPTE